MRVLTLAAALTFCGCQATEQVSTTEQAVVVVSPTTHSFGSVEVGQASAPFTITISPGVGPTDETVTSVTTGCSAFSIDAPGLPAEVIRTCLPICPGHEGTPPPPICQTPIACQTDDFETYSFNATFQPTVAATVNCVVTIAGSSPKTMTLTGTGTPPPIHLDVEPPSLGFGDVRRNTDSGAANLSVANLGGATLTVSSVSISAGFAIVAGPTTGFTVGGGASQGYSLICHPTDLGAVGGAFVINSDDPNTPQLSIPLSCNGIDSVLDVTPSPAVLATTRVGEPVQLTMSIDNSGNISTTLESVAVTGDLTMLSGPPDNTVLAAGGTTPAIVSFAATTAGDASGTLTVTYDGGQTRATQLTARALTTSLSLDPDGDVDFGPVCAGQTATKTFTLIANSDGPFQLQDVVVAGGPFTVMPPALPVTLQGAAANSTTFDVVVAPTDAGQVSGTVTLMTDIPNGTPHTVNLAVTGLQGGVTPTPATVDFGSSPLDVSTTGQQVHLSNCLTTAVTTSNPRIEGTDAAEFSIVASPPTASIDPAGLASWLVVFQGHTVGLKDATFSVDYDGGTASIDLTAEALGSDTGNGSGSGSGSGDGLASYYACSTGGPAGATPIALVLIVLGIRRRRR